MSTISQQNNINQTGTALPKQTGAVNNNVQSSPSSQYPYSQNLPGQTPQIYPYNGYYPPSVGAVSINIHNPTAGGPVNYPMPYPNYTQWQQPPAIPNQQNIQNNQQNNQNIVPPNQQNNPPTEQKPAEPQQMPAEPLPTEYIKSLENYLNNQNPDIRLSAAKEILNRFKQDKARAQDLALTSLLNKALQDPSPNVRAITLATLKSGYAQGDDLTVQLLKQMQTSKSMYNQDAIEASNVLLKMSGRNLNVQSNSTNTPALPPNQPGVGQNLNLVAK